MPRLIPTSTTKRLYPRHDPNRIAAVVSAVDYDRGCGLIRINDEDVFFCHEDFLGDFNNVRPGQTVTYLPYGPMAVLVCNIHDDDSVAALIAHQNQPAYA